MEESVGVKEIHFTVVNPINVDVHCLVLAMTYQEYDSHYAGLSEKYPELQPFSVSNEYDEAERKPVIQQQNIKNLYLAN